MIYAILSPDSQRMERDIMGYKENKLKYNIEYKKTHEKRVPLDLTLQKYEEVKIHAQERSESVNGFIKRAINETIERDKKL